jgi:hypothetical protein
MLQAPVECTLRPAGGISLTSYMTGRAAFQTPNLLGGQAARAGLTCASCHNNGRGNPHFSFPGLSGAPGTADVTSSVMSKKRGDGIANPVPIPDLAITPPKISRAVGDPALRAFIRGLIVEEFDGAEPSAAVLDGLTLYVRSMSAAACGGRSDAAITASTALSDASDATEVALRHWSNDDNDSSRMMLASARAALGRIHERFAGPTLRKQRASIERLDHDLLTIQQAVDRDAPSVDRLITRWQARMAMAAPAIQAGEPLSLYAPERLSAALAGR